MMMIVEALLMALLPQERERAASSQDSLVIEGPEETRGSETTYRFFCSDQTIEFQTYVTRRDMNGTGSFISHILFDDLPIPYDTLYRLNATLEGSTIQRIELVYCNPGRAYFEQSGEGRVADHDSRVAIYLTPPGASSLEPEVLELEFLERRLVNTRGYP